MKFGFRPLPITLPCALWFTLDGKTWAGRVGNVSEKYTASALSESDSLMFFFSPPRPHVSRSPLLPLIRLALRQLYRRCTYPLSTCHPDILGLSPFFDWEGHEL
jgi:hypothetical protein